MYRKKWNRKLNQTKNNVQRRRRHLQIELWAQQIPFWFLLVKHQVVAYHFKKLSMHCLCSRVTCNRMQTKQKKNQRQLILKKINKCIILNNDCSQRFDICKAAPSSLLIYLSLLCLCRHSTHFPLFIVCVGFLCARSTESCFAMIEFFEFLIYVQKWKLFQVSFLPVAFIRL